MKYDLNKVQFNWKQPCWIFALIFSITLSILPAKATDIKPKFELLHIWGSDGETRALAAYSQAAKTRGVDWTEHIVFFNFLGVRAMFAKRLAVSVPPSGLFWIGGDSAAQMIDEGLFRKIPTKFGKIDYSKILLPEVYEVVRYNDSITMLPVGSHIQNRIFYNQEILKEVGAEQPKTWDEFLQLAPKVAQAGYYALIVTDLDLSRNCAAPLIAYYALKENTHGNEANRRI